MGSSFDWKNDPPPDLVVEIDVTSYSDVEDYLPYRVPEVWLFKQKLLVYQLRGREYQLQIESRYFPTIQLQDTSARCMQIAYDRNTSAAIRDLRSQTLRFESAQRFCQAFDEVRQFLRPRERMAELVSLSELIECFLARVDELQEIFRVG